MQSLKHQSDFWNILGKAIAQQPKGIQSLLDKHNVLLKKRDDSKELLEGVLTGLSRNDKTFNAGLTQILSSIEKNDQFIGAIAGAVGGIAGAIGSGQQKKAMKEQARAQTFSSIMNYKAQQEANRIEELKLRQKEKVSPQKSPGFQHQTIIIIAGVVVALLILGLVYYQKNNASQKIQQITQPVKK